MGGDSTIKTYEFSFSATIPGQVISTLQFHNGIYSATGTITSKKLFETNIFVVLEHHIQITNNFTLWWMYAGAGSYTGPRSRTNATGTVSPTELSSENLSSITQEHESFLNTSVSVAMVSTAAYEPSDQSYYSRIRLNASVTGNTAGFTYPNEYLFAQDGRYIFQPVFESRPQTNFDFSCITSYDWIQNGTGDGSRVISATVDKSYVNLYMKKPIV